MINNNYLETRKRVCRFKGNKDLSDKDIIEYLGEEIDEYRSKIRKLEEIIEEYQGQYQLTDSKTEKNLAVEILNGMCIEEIRTYDKGKLISSTKRYKYKDDIQEEITKEISKKVRGDEVFSLIQPEKLDAIYKAKIFEYNSGRTDVVYVCDKENNKECNKKSCTLYNDCEYTFNKKYAKNFL